MGRLQKLTGQVCEQNEDDKVLLHLRNPKEKDGGQGEKNGKDLAATVDDVEKILPFRTSVGGLRKVAGPWKTSTKLTRPTNSRTFTHQNITERASTA